MMTDPRSVLPHPILAALALILATAAALAAANSALAPTYAEMLAHPVRIAVNDLQIDKPLLLWINDGLMSVFFLLIGLELKRELQEGQISSVRRAALPVLAALGGMAVPAAIFVALNGADAGGLRGWAIPTATDVAFALGILALAGPGVPTTLRVFLMALAVIDDLGAIIIIATFYSEGIAPDALMWAGGAGAVLLAMNLIGIRRLGPYLLVGLLLWVSVLESGIHATLAGVLLALVIPGRSDKGSPLEALEHALAPWVAWVVMPVFAFANAGVPVIGLTLADLLAPLPLGIAAGLFLGKQAGVMAISWLAVRLRLGALPEGVSWLSFYGAALLTGIGFTMSLFVGSLAFGDPGASVAVRLGVLSGSLASAAMGIIVLMIAGWRVRAACRRRLEAQP